MATVHIPAAMRTLTGGLSHVEASGETVLTVVRDLEARHPGFEVRVLDGDRLRAGLAVFLNGEQVPPHLRSRVVAEDRIYFAPAIGGG